MFTGDLYNCHIGLLNYQQTIQAIHNNVIVINALFTNGAFIEGHIIPSGISALTMRRNSFEFSSGVFFCRIAINRFQLAVIGLVATLGLEGYIFVQIENNHILCFIFANSNAPVIGALQRVAVRCGGSYGNICAVALAVNTALGNSLAIPHILHSIACSFLHVSGVEIRISVYSIRESGNFAVNAANVPVSVKGINLAILRYNYFRQVFLIAVGLFTNPHQFILHLTKGILSSTLQEIQDGGKVLAGDLYLAVQMIRHRLTFIKGNLVRNELDLLYVAFRYIVMNLAGHLGLIRIKDRSPVRRAARHNSAIHSAGPCHNTAGNIFGIDAAPRRTVQRNGAIAGRGSPATHAGIVVQVAGGRQHIEELSFNGSLVISRHCVILVGFIPGAIGDIVRGLSIRGG